MAYEFKKLNDVEIVETPIDTANVLIEEDGVIKKAPKSAIGGVSGGSCECEPLQLIMWNDDDEIETPLPMLILDDISTFEDAGVPGVGVTPNGYVMLNIGWLRFGGVGLLVNHYQPLVYPEQIGDTAVSFVDKTLGLPPLDYSRHVITGSTGFVRVDDYIIDSVGKTTILTSVVKGQADNILTFTHSGIGFKDGKTYLFEVIFKTEDIMSAQILHDLKITRLT